MKNRRTWREGKLWSSIRLMHPKNLAKEVHIYGYHYSWKSQGIWMVAVLAGISAVGAFFKLTASGFFIVTVTAVCLFPVLVVDMYKRMYEQKRFADVAAYMEQVLYSFLKTGKVLSALKESRELFDSGLMRQTLEQAIHHMEMGKSDSAQGILKESLGVIESRYQCRKLYMMHNLLNNVEAYGGDAEDSAMLLLEDLELWKKRTYQLQAEKKKSHVDNVISILVAVLLCAVALYVMDAMKGLFASRSDVDIFRIGVIQVSSVLFILFLYYVYAKSVRTLTKGWLTEKQGKEEDYLRKCYQMVKEYDSGKRKQKRLGYRLAKKDITREMRLALPQWFMEMALLLQGNNVEVAVQKSRMGVSVALQGELDALIARMKTAPGELWVYTDFCKDFDLPEVAGCMKMLHAIAENGSGDVKVQMNHFINRVNEMQAAADLLQNQAAAFRMKLLFSYPVVAATAKLLTDMTIGMIVMFQVLGSMGGA